MKLLRSPLQRRYDRLVRSLPLRSPIFLPTDKVPLEQAVEGLTRVKALYQTGLDTIHRPRLRELRRRYADTQRCFIIGNGPSLNHTALELLENEVTFGVNGFFLKARELTWVPTFYVVEDHLVAEDRAAEIEAFTGPCKLFPANLAYCLPEADDTIFFDHRPRISFPHGFDFSSDAASHTYAGCTVTFTCLQLATFLGFREIYLIGVDADYSMPSDVTDSASSGVGVLDMASDDPNHFNPDYFGKGYRWHDPQVDKMQAAYQEARRVTQGLGTKILNAGVGGKLEVFPRVEFRSLFKPTSPETDPAAVSDENARATSVERRRPRTVIFDITRMGDGSATGELKANLFEDWEEDRLLHVYAGRFGGVAVKGVVQGVLIDSKRVSLRRLGLILEQFAPQTAVYRPVPDRERLHLFVMRYFRSCPMPLIVWVMDDWLERLRLNSDTRFQRLHDDFCWLLERACVRLCISEPMKVAFGTRYEKEFTPLANGVNPDDWPLIPISNSGCFRVRYAGALADDMTLASVLRVAQAIESLASEGENICFEINTKQMWVRKTASFFVPLASCTVTTDLLDSAEYRSFLQGADAVLIGYNFDSQSKAYIGYSLANKLPECLMTGRPVLVHGPRGLATVDLMWGNVPEAVVCEPDVASLKQWFLKYMRFEHARQALADQCREFGVANFALATRKDALESLLRSSCDQPYRSYIRYCERDKAAKIDESALVSDLTQHLRGSDYLMLDVGAHQGSSLKPFIERGWRVIAFEPDSGNRERLVNRFGDSEGITIDSRAVADAPASATDFYRSPVSDGISGVLPFHETHRSDNTVEVTTLSRAAVEYQIERVDFLKIDVEGMDFAVLKGVPWNDLKPRIVICEFEDAKTRLVGHGWQDIADYLESKGYVVYVSEWYPIIRYGVQHQWRSLRRYPCKLADQSGWGNLLAFRDPPAAEELHRVLSLSLDAAPGTAQRLRLLVHRSPAWVGHSLREARKVLRWILARASW